MANRLKLSPIQIRALGEFHNEPLGLDGVELLIHVGYHWRRAIQLLDEKGLVSYRGTRYYLSAEGKEEVKRLLESGELVKEEV